MRPKPSRKALNRRSFLRQSASVAGLLGTAVLSGRWRSTLRAAAVPNNPFAYDLGEVAKTDPGLVQYEEVGRFAASHEDPRRIRVGPDDSIYLAAGKYVTVLDHGGIARSEIALSGPARCVAASRTGEVYVGLRDHVEVFDRKGRQLASWSSPGPRTWLTGLAAAKDGVFATDAGNRVLLRYDLNGKVVKRIGEKNKTQNTPGFIVPSPFFDVVIHRDGILRVTNPGRHRVEGYTTDGEYEFAWGKPSAAIDGFCGCCNPVSLTSLPDGRLITCEKGLPRVKIYQSDGTFDGVVAGVESFRSNARAAGGDGLSDSPHGGLDAAADSSGRVYVLDLVEATIRVMAPKTTKRTDGRQVPARRT